jgi:hypothetical protein
MSAAKDPSLRLMQADRPLVESAGREAQTSAYVTGLGFAGHSLLAGLGDGTVWALGREGEPRVAAAHQGTVLCAAADPEGCALLTDGDDGRLCRNDDAGTHRIARSAGRWIDAVACSDWGAIAYAAGRVVTVTWGGRTRLIEAPSAGPALAFFRNKRKLAIAHYGGVTIADLRPRRGLDRLLDWKGVHLVAGLSAGDRFLVTGMAENALHVWRLDNDADLWMSGFPSKPKSLAWLAGGDALAVSGADGVLVWPFDGADGPRGKKALVLARRAARVTCVAGHPASDVVAAGYDDGAVALARLQDDATLLVRAPQGDPVTALSFDRDGACLGYGTEAGALGLCDLRPGP